eukprot:tig00000144_g9178.t1
MYDPGARAYQRSPPPPPLHPGVDFDRLIGGTSRRPAESQCLQLPEEAGDRRIRSACARARGSGCEERARGDSGKRGIEATFLVFEAPQIFEDVFDRKSAALRVCGFVHASRRLTVMWNHASLPQTGTAETWNCHDGGAPADFEQCLPIRGDVRGTCFTNKMHYFVCWTENTVYFVPFEGAMAMIMTTYELSREFVNIKTLWSIDHNEVRIWTGSGHEFSLIIKLDKKENKYRIEPKAVHEDVRQLSTLPSEFASDALNAKKLVMMQGSGGEKGHYRFAYESEDTVVLVDEDKKEVVCQGVSSDALVAIALADRRLKLYYSEKGVARTKPETHILTAANLKGPGKNITSLYLPPRGGGLIFTFGGESSVRFMPVHRRLRDTNFAGVGNSIHTIDRSNCAPVECLTASLSFNVICALDVRRIVSVYCTGKPAGSPAGQHALAQQHALQLPSTVVPAASSPPIATAIGGHPPVAAAVQALQVYPSSSSTGSARPGAGRLPDPKEVIRIRDKQLAELHEVCGTLRERQAQFQSEKVALDMRVAELESEKGTLCKRVAEFERERDNVRLLELPAASPPGLPAASSSVDNMAAAGAAAAAGSSGAGSSGGSSASPAAPQPRTSEGDGPRAPATLSAPQSPASSAPAASVQPAEAEAEVPAAAAGALSARVTQLEKENVDLADRLVKVERERDELKRKRALKIGSIKSAQLTTANDKINELEAELKTAKADLVAYRVTAAAGAAAAAGSSAGGLPGTPFRGPGSSGGSSASPVAPQPRTPEDNGPRAPATLSAPQSPAPSAPAASVQPAEAEAEGPAAAAGAPAARVAELEREKGDLAARLAEAERERDDFKRERDGQVAGVAESNARIAQLEAGVEELKTANEKIAGLQAELTTADGELDAHRVTMEEIQRLGLPAVSPPTDACAGPRRPALVAQVSALQQAHTLTALEAELARATAEAEAAASLREEIGVLSARVKELEEQQVQSDQVASARIDQLERQSISYLLAISELIEKQQPGASATGGDAGAAPSSSSSAGDSVARFDHLMGRLRGLMGELAASVGGDGAAADLGLEAVILAACSTLESKKQELAKLEAAGAAEKERAALLQARVAEAEEEVGALREALAGRLAAVDEEGKAIASEQSAAAAAAAAAAERASATAAAKAAAAAAAAAANEQDSAAAIAKAEANERLATVNKRAATNAAVTGALKGLKDVPMKRKAGDSAAAPAPSKRGRPPPRRQPLGPSLDKENAGPAAPAAPAAASSKGGGPAPASRSAVGPLQPRSESVANAPAASAE